MARAAPIEWLAEERGAEALDHAGHGVEVEKPAPMGRYQAGRIDHGRGEHPELDHERDYVAKIAIGYGERRQERADAKRREDAPATSSGAISRLRLQPTPYQAS